MKQTTTDLIKEFEKKYDTPISTEDVMAHLYEILLQHCFDSHVDIHDVSISVESLDGLSIKQSWSDRNKRIREMNND